MHYAPDAPALLQAVAAFLAEDLRPAIKSQDPALAFRVLITESLCRIAAGELQSEDMLDMMEWARLAELLPIEAAALGEVGRSRPERHDAILDDAIQMHGGAGYSDDLPFAQWYRHARAARIADGPDEVHTLVIARDWLLGRLELLA